MQILTLSPLNFFLFIVLFFNISIYSQSQQDVQKLENLILDAVFFTNIYVDPATNAAVYQASNSWISTTQKKNLWDFTVGVHGNFFVVPKSNREFTIKNSDFKFFSIQNGTTAQAQTTLGSKEQILLTGNIGGQDILVKTPQGINTDVASYGYIQAAVGLLFGTELVIKVSPKVAIKKFDYQIYGAGLKHNISQYFPDLESKNMYLALFAGYSKEDLSVVFLDAQTPYGNLGLNGLNSTIDTYQVQFNGSKVFRNLEIAAGLIFNTSSFDYVLNGSKGEIENTIPIQKILNQQLEGLSSTKQNFLAEVSARYQFNKIYVQTIVGLGKFINTNLSIQYEF